jgi:hypothetical protein
VADNATKGNRSGTAAIAINTKEPSVKTADGKRELSPTREDRKTM